MNESEKKAEILENFLSWLEQDSENASLLIDTVDAAITANELDKADQLIAGYSESHSLTPEMLNLAGIIALRKQNFDDAVARFQQLLDEGHSNPGTRFNLAWSYAMLDQNAEALAMIDDQMTTNLPQAAALKVHMMHSEGKFDEAMEEAKSFAAIHPDDPGLMANMSVLALDVEDADLAKICAEKAGSHPDALTTLGTLELGDHDLDSAQQRFTEALRLNDKNPRAWIGQGLTRLRAGSKKAALSDLDKGAEIFGTHIGSWIASGWGYFINGDQKTARERFQTAYDLDPNFAESHGSLAVLAAVEGDLERAEKRCETALRLDRQCFSAALARTLILQARGDTAKAERVFDLALNTPIDHNGATLADNLLRMGSGIPAKNSTIH